MEKSSKLLHTDTLSTASVPETFDFSTRVTERSTTTLEFSDLPSRIAFATESLTLSPRESMYFGSRTRMLSMHIFKVACPSLA